MSTRPGRLKPATQITDNVQLVGVQHSRQRQGEIAAVAGRETELGAACGGQDDRVCLGDTSPRHLGPQGMLQLQCSCGPVAPEAEYGAGSAAAGPLTPKSEVAVYP